MKHYYNPIAAQKYDFKIIQASLLSFWTGHRVMAGLPFQKLWWVVGSNSHSFSWNTFYAACKNGKVVIRSSAFTDFSSKIVFRWQNYKEKLRFCTLTNLNLGLELYFLTRLIPNCYLDAENYRYLVFKAKKVEVQSLSQYQTFKNRKHSKTRLFGLWYSNGVFHLNTELKCPAF